jgi:multicomponent Na+:H+ antiporter subunit B
MTSVMINIFLVSLMVVIAVMVVRTHRLFAVIVMSGAYSLISAAMFVNLDAVDVAFTEAAVGAGISTVLLLAAMARLPAEEKPLKTNVIGPLAVVAIVGVLLVTAVVDLPAFGSADAPAHTHVAPRYLAESDAKLHIPNVVTTVLASYRGFDTLGETIVIFAAGLGVLLLLAGKTKTPLPDDTKPKTTRSATRAKASSPPKKTRQSSAKKKKAAKKGSSS